MMGCHVIRLQEHSAEQLSSLKTEHVRVLDQLRATYALEHSSSKVAEVTNELNAQKVPTSFTVASGRPDKCSFCFKLFETFTHR